MGRKVSLFIGIAAFVSLSASASLVTYDFTALVGAVDPLLTPGGTFFVGENVSGSFSIDTSVPDTSIFPNEGRYAGGLSTLNATIGSYGATAVSGIAFVLNDFNDSGEFFDQFSTNNGILPLAGANVNGLILFDLGLFLQDLTMTAFASTSLSNANMLILSDFAVRQFSLEFIDPSNVLGPPSPLVADLTSLELSNVSNGVPEPATLALLGLGLAGLGLSRRKQ